MATARKPPARKPVPKRFTTKSDDAADKKARIREDSKRDKALDKKRGVK